MEFTYEPPPGNESLEEFWIFGLCLPTFSDHIFWGLVDRTGKNRLFTMSSTDSPTILLLGARSDIGRALVHRFASEGIDFN